MITIKVDDIFPFKQFCWSGLFQNRTIIKNYFKKSLSHFVVKIVVQNVEFWDFFLVFLFFPSVIECNVIKICVPPFFSLNFSSLCYFPFFLLDFCPLSTLTCSPDLPPRRSYHYTANMRNFPLTPACLFVLQNQYCSLWKGAEIQY